MASWGLSARADAGENSAADGPAFVPTFRMDPLVFECQARVGQTVRFQFQLYGSEQVLDLHVQPVSLVQQRDGTITASTERQLPGTVRLDSPPELRLRSGERTKITGTWTLPSGNGQFHAAGLMVTDRSQHEQTVEQGTRPLGVRFVTRYLLRLEAEIHQLHPATSIQLASGQLSDQGGFAFANVLLRNPGRAGQRFTAKARLTDTTGHLVMDDIPLVLPVRMNQPEAKRSQVIVLPETEVLLAGRLPDPVFPGDYQLEIIVGSGRGVSHKQQFPVTVLPEQFLAQRSVVARVLKTIDIQPREIELSTLRRGNRIMPLALENKGREAVAIQLQAIDANGQPLKWLSVRPKTLTLAPGRRRNVMVSLSGRDGGGKDHYATLTVAARGTGSGSQGITQLPVAWLNAARQPAENLALGRLEMREGKTPMLQLSLENQGTRHQAPHLVLTLADDRLTKVRREAGYHAWVLPGQQQVYRFPIPDLYPGRYTATIERISERGAQPVTSQQQITIR